MLLLFLLNTNDPQYPLLLPLNHHPHCVDSNSTIFAIIWQTLGLLINISWTVAICGFRLRATSNTHTTEGGSHPLLMPHSTRLPPKTTNRVAVVFVGTQLHQRDRQRDRKDVHEGVRTLLNQKLNSIRMRWSLVGGRVHGMKCRLANKPFSNKRHCDNMFINLLRILLRFTTVRTVCYCMIRSFSSAGAVKGCKSHIQLTLSLSFHNDHHWGVHLQTATTIHSFHFHTTFP